MSEETISLEQLVGSDLEENFLSFDMTEIQNVLSSLAGASAHDLAHAELYQQQSLRAADILAEYLSKMVKTVSHLENKANAAKNKVILDYEGPAGAKVTADMRKSASESDPGVGKILEQLAVAKGSKLLLEKKYDILVRTHHFYKDIATSYKRTILSVPNGMPNELKNPAEGWEG